MRYALLSLRKKLNINKLPMSKTSTNQDIVKYVYNELEEEKQNQFNFKYLTDPKIRNEVEMISNTKKVLDNLCLILLIQLLRE